MSDSQHSVEQLVGIFNQCFLQTYNVQLVPGGDEPLYLPARQQCNASFRHQLICREDFFSSALHEVAHWCIAGKKRREKIDFGYWYFSEGRNIKQQRAFMEVEVRPQALEFIFSQAAAYPFYLSMDDFSTSEKDKNKFAESIAQQAKKYCQSGLSKRAGIFVKALKNFYKTDFLLSIDQVSREKIF
jgi:elongation factor P hydroxylase